MNSSFSGFPRQKVSSGKKTKKWFKDCVDSVDKSGFFHDEGVRASWEEKLINLNLYNGKLNSRDIAQTLNPDDLEDTSVPTNMQHYPIINPRIDVLVGEEAKRRFDFKTIVTNPDAISAKEEDYNKFLRERVVELIRNEYSEDELKKKFQDLEEDIKSYQDKREIMANRLLKHLWNEHRLERTFNAGFKDALILGEEYYESNIVSGEPYLKKLDPNKIFWVKSGFSNKVEDSDLIILDDYWAPSKVIDHYHEELSSKDIDKLERGYGGSSGDPFVDTMARDFMPMRIDILDSDNPEDQNAIDSLINVGQANGYHLQDSYDSTGNIRVLRVFWKGFRKVKKVTYFDQFGDEQTDIFPESYIPKKDEGEHAENLWINEWYEGTKIGHDIYVNLRPKQIQYRSMNNPSYCHPGITGRTYSFNSSRTVSLMGKVKNYLYLYDAIHDRLNKLLAKNHGRILQMDFATVPEGWDAQKWFHYLKKMNIAVVDSFKEGNKGAATGKLAGGMNNASKGYIDMDQGANIQQHIALLQFIKQEMTEITGVSDQRLGQISNRETVGGVERSVTQSSHITEWYFAEHDEVKLEALRVYLETAKIAYKGRNKKVQYILDDQSIQLLNLDGTEFGEHDYGLVITSSSKTQEAEQNLRRLAESALSAGAIGFDTVASIYLSDSLADVKSKIEKAERQKQQRESAQAEEANKIAKQQMEQEQANKEAERALEESKNILDNNTKLQVALIGKEGEFTEQDEEDFEKLKIEREKISNDMVKFYEKLELDKKKLAQDKEQFNKKLQVDKQKAKSSTKK